MTVFDQFESNLQIGALLHLQKMMSKMFNVKSSNANRFCSCCWFIDTAILTK